jgi:UDP-N-acetylmuramate: L-alanyl-gamma-D-glutamyl-meso-diaminopimelate ligase
MTLPDRLHIIGIGQPLMSSLATHLSGMGVRVTGSDASLGDQTAEALRQSGLLAVHAAWDPEHITPETGTVVLGKSISPDNPEYRRALALGLKVYYYPEFVYQLCCDKQRIVIVGSKGRTNATALIIFMLKSYDRPVDYLVEGTVSWLEQPVHLSDAPVVVIEGTDEPDPRGQSAGFLHYQHHIGMITTIAWDSQDYSSEDHYVAQFDAFADNTPKAGILLYNETHTLVSVIGSKHRPDVTGIPFKIHPHTSESGQHYVLTDTGRLQVQVYGTQNFESMAGCRELLKRIGLPQEKFYQALPGFTL